LFLLLTFLVESIFGGLLKKAPAIIEKYESKVFKQNEKNRALEAKQRINKCKLAMLQREEAEWLKVEAELEKNAEEAYSMLQIPLDEDDEPMEEPLEDNGTELKTMMKDALQASMFMADRVALCTERSAQLQRTAERYNDRLQALVTKETHSVDELQRLKQQRYLEDAGLSNGDFELDFLKQLGPVPSNEMHVL
jgi:DNA repair ATPase RecN